MHVSAASTLDNTGYQDHEVYMLTLETLIATVYY